MERLVQSDYLLSSQTKVQGSLVGTSKAGSVFACDCGNARKPLCVGANQPNASR